MESEVVFRFVFACYAFCKVNLITICVLSYHVYFQENQEQCERL